MSYTQITARIVDQALQLVNVPLLASGSKGTLQIRCEFDALWNGYGKVGVFYRSEEDVFHMPLVENVVTVPDEVLIDSGFFFFGIMGVAENTRTTEVLRVVLQKGAITTATATPVEPAPDIYQQLLAAYGVMGSRIDELVGMRFPGGVQNFTLSDDSINGFIRSNGASAYINFSISGLGLAAGTAYYTDWCISPALAPLAHIALESTNVDLNVTLIPPEESDESNGCARLRIENVGSNFWGSEMSAQVTGVYPLSSVNISELADARVDASGKTHSTAGEAIREQVKNLDAKIGLSGAPAIIETVAGVSIAVGDAADRPLKGLVLYGKTMQNGVPTPQAPIPLVTAGANENIIARISGKNLWDNANAIIKYGGKAVTLSETGFDFVRGSYVGSVRVNTNIPLAKGQTVTFSCSYTGDSTYCYIYPDASQSTALKSGLGSVTYTATEDYPDANFVVIINSNGGDTSVTNIQVEFGAEVTGYEAFKPVQPLHISTPNGLPGIKMQPTCKEYNFVDADGNKWFTDEIDLARGTYIHRCFFMTFDGSENWVTTSTGLPQIGSVQIPALENQIVDSYGHQCHHICSHVLSVPRNNRTTNTVNSYGGANGKTLQFLCYDYENNLDGWKAYLSAQAAAGTPMTMVLGMNTPVETALSEEVIEQYKALYTAKGETTISNDGSAFMELSYIADTKLYIDQKLAAISAAILNNQGGKANV